MQGINLARRPFVNRRPVFRLAVLLWIVGVALAIFNVRQYAGHWQGISVNHQRLTEIDRRVREARAGLEPLDRQLAGVSLSGEKRRVAFLNQLIAYRTFPWSALFDDLEEVLPLDVKLLSVKPTVKLVAEPEEARRQPRGRRPPRPAAARPAQAAAEGADDDASLTEQSESSSTEEDAPLRRDEVRLQLSGVAKSEDALAELIDVLYANPSFRSPFLPGENFDEGGAVRFTLSTIYLTRRPEPVLEAIGEEPVESASAAPADLAAIEAAETDSVRQTGETAMTGRARRGAAGSQSAAKDHASADPSRSEGARPGGAAERGAAERGAAERGAAERGAAERPPGRQTAVPGGQVRPRALPGQPAAARAGSLPIAAQTGPGVARSAPGSGVPARSAPGSGAPGSGAPGSSPPPPSEPPGFAQPTASATPELRGGAGLVLGLEWRRFPVSESKA